MVDIKDDMWSCPHCTLDNESTATICSVCDNDKPRDVGSGKGKGRDQPSRSSTNAASNVAQELNSEKDQEGFVVPLADRRQCNGWDSVQGLREGAAGFGGEKYDHSICDMNVENEFGDGTHAVSPEGKGILSESERISGQTAQHELVELDATNETDSDSYNAVENWKNVQLLFGRGWNNKVRHTGLWTPALRCNQDLSRHRGTKRRRPIPSTTSEAEIAVWGVHADEDIGSEEEEKPLISPPRRVGNVPAYPALWKWPPRHPHNSVCVASDSASSSAAVARCTTKTTYHEKKNPANISADTVETSLGRGGIGEGTNEADADVHCDGNQPGEVGKDMSLLECSPSGRSEGLTETAITAQQQPVETLQRKQSRLSLPKRAHEDPPTSAPQESTEYSSLTPPENLQGVPESVVTSGAEIVATMPECGEGADHDERSSKGNESAGKDAGLAGATEEDSKSKDTRNLVVNSLRGIEAEGPGNGSSTTSERRSSGVDHCVVATSEEGGNNANEAEIKLEALGGAVIGSVRCTDGDSGGEPSRNVPATASVVDPASISKPRRRGMVMCMGDDSETDSNGEREAQVTPQTRLVRLEKTIEAEGSSPPDASPSTPPLTLDKDTASNEIVSTATFLRDARDDTKSSDEGAVRKCSPDQTSMNLVDTLRHTTSGSLGLRTARKSAASSKASEVLTPAFSHGKVSQDTKSADDLVKRKMWSCDRCTLLNRARTKSCVACSSPRPGISPGTVGMPSVHDRLDVDTKGSRASQRGQRLKRQHDDGKYGSGQGSENIHDMDEVSEKLDGFVGNVEAILGESETDPSQKTGSGGEYEDDCEEDYENDEDYEDEGEGGCDDDDDDDDDDDWKEDEDNDDEEVEVDSDVVAQEKVGSRIEEICLRLQKQRQNLPTQSPVSKRPRQDRGASGNVLDLTDTVEEGAEGDDKDASNAKAAGKAAKKSSDAYIFVEDISDDDDDFTITVGTSKVHGLSDTRWDGRSAGARAQSTLPSRKYRFFASVEEHREGGTSCVDFGQLEAQPHGESGSRARRYEARKMAREVKGSRLKPGEKVRSTKSSGPGRGSCKTAGSARRGKAAGRSQGHRLGGGTSGAKPNIPAFRGSGGLPSSDWIPAGIRGRLGYSSANGQSGTRSSSGGAGRGAARQPFNHYQRSDEVIQDTEGGGGLHWEHAGRSTFGD